MTDSVALMRRAVSGPNGVWFSRPDPDGRLASHDFTLSADAWQAMGSPEWITVIASASDGAGLENLESLASLLWRELTSQGWEGVEPVELAALAERISAAGFRRQGEPQS